MTDERVCTVLFTEGNQINLMDSETFEQFFVDIGILGDTKKFLTDGMKVTVDTVEAIPVSVRLPQQVTLEVIEADIRLAVPEGMKLPKVSCMIFPIAPTGVMSDSPVARAATNARKKVITMAKAPK